MWNKIKFLLRTNHFLQLLLIADVFYIILHVSHMTPFVKAVLPMLREEAFSINQEHGLAEGFQYIQEFWIVLALILLVTQKKKPAYTSWALMFTFLLFDDMLEIHERLGQLFSETINSSLPIFDSFTNLRLVDIGELFTSFVFGVFFLLIISISYFRSSHDIKKEFNTLFIMLGILVFFGVGIDFLDRFFTTKIIREGLKLIEDGGEMLTMSIICWYTYTLNGLSPLSSNSS